MLRRLARAAVAHGLACRREPDRAADAPLILGYHRVLADGLRSAAGVPGLSVSPRTLERQLEFVGRRFRFVSLDELGARLETGDAAGLAAVTFDDGYVEF